MSINSHVKKVIISNSKIKSGIKKAAKWINLNYKNSKPLLLGVLKGCIPFFGQLLTHIKINCDTDFMSVASFHGGVKASSEPILKLDLSTNVSGRDVLIIEDIIDSANTLSKIIDLLKNRNAKSVKILTLLDKPSGRKVPLDADYSCFTIPNLFIVGFGLDYKEEYRNLNCIAILKEKYIK